LGRASRRLWSGGGEREAIKNGREGREEGGEWMRGSRWQALWPEEEGLGAEGVNATVR
jgi:hypothetical protein